MDTGSITSGESMQSINMENLWSACKACLMATLTCLTMAACGVEGESTVTEESAVEGESTVAEDAVEGAEAIEVGAQAAADGPPPWLRWTGYNLGAASFHPYDEILEVCDFYPTTYGVVVYYHTSSNPTGTWFQHSGRRLCVSRNLDLPESGWIQMHVCLLEPSGAFGCSESRRYSAQG